MRLKVKTEKREFPSDILFRYKYLNVLVSAESRRVLQFDGRKELLCCSSSIYLLKICVKMSEIIENTAPPSN